MTVIKAGSAKTEQSVQGDPRGAYVAELLSDSGGLTQFGAFVEELAAGARSSLPHWHREEDEMVLVLDGAVTVIEDGVETLLEAGDAACWPAGEPVAHCLANRGKDPVRYLVIGTRAPRDRVTYPGHDRVLHIERTSGERRFTTLRGAPADPPQD